MIEQGAPFFSTVEAPFYPRPSKTSAPDWRQHALTAYRRAYALNLRQDPKGGAIGPGDSMISFEAGMQILSLLKTQRLTRAESAEATRVGRSVQKLKHRPQAPITPIIFPLNGGAELRALLSPKRRRAFQSAWDAGSRWVDSSHLRLDARAATSEPAQHQGQIIAAEKSRCGEPPVPP
jgi:hypothetical protein